MNYDKEQVEKLYSQGFSTFQIKERLSLTVDPRTLQRYLAKRGLIRPRKIAYDIAVKEKRLGPKIRRPKIHYLKLPPKLRYMIFQRDNFKCQICGIDAKHNGILEIDHIDRNIRNNDPLNLQVICYECNLGKRIFK